MKYSTSFFEGQMGGSRGSAPPIVAVCMEVLTAKSVVDVGCGVGAWLAEFKRQGAQRIVGLDGEYVDRNLLQIDVEEFHPWDLAQSLPSIERFDLALSLEVGEHLPQARAASFVADLTALAPAVLFSAAIPGQGGTDHVNEQWQDYWADLFREVGYRPHDCVRPTVWNDSNVQPWYAQNALLYLHESVNVPQVPGMPLRVVHPELMMRKTEAPLRARELRHRARATVDDAWRRALSRGSKLVRSRALRRRT